jgi:acyl-CoA reductase-like NAD-dependent aldehyde dehydrogenase
MNIQNPSPVDFHPLTPVRMNTEPEVQEAVARARAAQSAWEALGLDGRAKLMKKAAREMLVRRQEVLELLSDEIGKTGVESLMAEAAGPLQYLKDWINVARPGLKTRKLQVSKLAFPGKSGVIEMIPRGVVWIIAPWNFPLANFFKPVNAALLCGNTVVVKPSEFAPLTAAWFVERMNEFLPAGVLNLVQGDKDVGQWLVKSGVDALTFTGSFYSGREVAKLAAEQMIPVSVELGGKDAAIVLADCDLDRTVAGVMNWALHNTGQACSGIERLYIEESIADEFVGLLAAAMSSLQVHSGDPMISDIGPAANARQLAIVEDHVQEALSKGAKLLTGGKRTGKGLWFEPTLLDQCDHSMKIMREPTFGPVIPVTRFKTIEEAVTLANDCEYGLNGSVWSKNRTKAAAIARRLQVGTAFVNNHAFTGAMPSAPWTGVKKSGYGIANSAFAIQHYTRPRTLVLDSNKKADGWWLPNDADAIELGHSLAEAQLGNIRAALKIPFLMARRQKTVLNFIRKGAGALSKKKYDDLQPKRMGRTIHFLSSIRKFIPALNRWELAWGEATMRSMYTDPKIATAIEPISKKETFAKMQDIYKNLPFIPAQAMRFMLWVIGWSPLFVIGKLKTIDRLNVADRLKVVTAFASSDSYLARQVAFFFKLNGGLIHVSTTRFHDAFSAPQQKPAAEPLRRGEMTHASETQAQPLS